MQGLTAVDVPGHENFKKDVLEEAAKSKGIVFLIDTRSRQNIYKSAQYLYDILTSRAVQATNIGLLIVSNFTDHKDSVAEKELKSDLEKEMYFLC